MANRRMFSKKITDTDLFIDMPASAQNLYFHLNMSADDDGFAGSPKKVQRTVGASQDDLKILMDKNFIIPFETGVVVIKDWKIHNYIRGDRYSETIYINEKQQLALDEKGSYILSNNQGLPNDNQMSYQRETQVRLGKDRSGKDRLGHLHNELAAIQNFYEDNGFGTLSSKTRTDFSYWIEDFKKIGATEEDARELIILAMEKAVDYNARKYSYINSILRDWEQKKLITLEQVKAMENERENANKQQRFNRDNNKPDYSTWVSSGDDF